MKTEVKNRDYYLVEDGLKTVEFKELDDIFDNQVGCIRMYQNFTGINQDGDHFTLQFRAFQPLKNGKKERSLIATASLSLPELRWLLEKAESLSKSSHGLMHEDDL